MRKGGREKRKEGTKRRRYKISFKDNAIKYRKRFLKDRFC